MSEELEGLLRQLRSGLEATLRAESERVEDGVLRVYWDGQPYVITARVEDGE